MTSGILGIFLIGAGLLIAILTVEWYYAKRIIDWADAQTVLVKKVFTEAWMVISIPDHMKDFKKTDAQVMSTATTPPTVLNFETLKEMLWLMLDMESDRRAARNRMANLMANLSQWEHDNPLPDVPIYRRRITKWYEALDKQAETDVQPPHDIHVGPTDKALPRHTK